MEKHFYVECANAELADKLLGAIAGVLGEIWAEPVTHPFEKSRLVPWNIDYLRECENFIGNEKRLSIDQAVKAGYNVGFHRGKFAQAKRKIEEARLTLDLLPAALAVPNFPACRALFYGIQSSLYSTREALKRSCKRIGGPAGEWWQATEADIVKNEPFIQFLHIDYNRDKHGEASGVLVPSIKLYRYAGPKPDMISGEGIFMIENKGSANPRRQFFANAECEMSIRIDFPNQIIGGRDVSAFPITDKLGRVIAHLEQLVVEADERFSEE